MSENEDTMNITMNGEPFTITRYNTSIYTFWGVVALSDGYEIDGEFLDHAFIMVQREPLRGAFLFEGHILFEKVFNFAVENDYPSYLNQTEVPDSDIMAYERFMFGDIRKLDHVPEDWVGKLDGNYEITEEEGDDDEDDDED